MTNVNRELILVKKWLDANKLSLNIDKTNYIIFQSSPSNIPCHPNIKIGKRHIRRVKFVKFLGLLLDEHLTCKYHLSELSKKLARTCGMFFRIRHLLPLDVLICLYNALFVSFLQYGVIVWGQTYVSQIDPIFKLQKKAVRAISFKPRISPSLPIFKDLKLLTICELSELRLLTFVFDYVNKTSPSCFHNFFSFSSSVHQYSKDRPVEVIYTCSVKTAFNIVLYKFVILVLNFEMLYLWNSEMLPQKFL